MTAGILATVLFSLSVVFANRTTRLLGGVRANLYRLCLATLLLGAWAHLVGVGLSGGALGWFLVSGCIGFGLGDLALYQALPRIGPRLAGLLVQCLAAPIAVLAEWIWIGTTLRPAQLLAGAVILTGVAVALAPENSGPGQRRLFWTGTAFGVVAALGQGLGAVVSRKAYSVVESVGGSVDGLSAAYQRILGGLIFAFPISLALLLRRASRDGTVDGKTMSETGRRFVWMWVILNALAGPTLGVGCYQWALATTPSGIVLPIVATMPIMVIPFAWIMEGDRPTRRAVLGGLIAVLGVILLARG